MKICNPLSKKLGVLQINSNVYEVEILFTVEFILFYSLHESIVILQLEMIRQTSAERYPIPILSMPKWMLYEMENAMDKCTTHTSVQIFSVSYKHTSKLI